MSVMIPASLTLYYIDTHFDATTTDRFGKHCGKRKKMPGRRNFSFFHNVSYSVEVVTPFVRIFVIISLFAVELEEPKIGISGKKG